MITLNRNTVIVKKYTERILQFGEGNFLRAFANWMIQQMNDKANFDTGVVVVQPIDQGLVKILNEQNGLYTLYLNGIKNSEAVSEHQIIDCIQRGINPYKDFDAYMANAQNPEFRFIIRIPQKLGSPITLLINLKMLHRRVFQESSPRFCIKDLCTSEVLLTRGLL